MLLRSRRTYQSGARTLERLEDNFEQIVEAGRLKELKGIGQALVQVSFCIVKGVSIL